MKYEYLLFNMIVLSGPVMMSFEAKVHYVKQWKNLFVALMLPLIIFVIWDVWATGRHWWFNENYVTGLKLFYLPVEEWLFFISVPFALIFVWEVFQFYFPKTDQMGSGWIFGIFLILFPVAIWAMVSGRQYTLLVCISLGLAIIFDWVFGTQLLRQRQVWRYLALVVGFTFFFNWYLTARPVVMYAVDYQVGWRIITIPVEDFGYGIAYNLLCLIFYEKRKKIVSQIGVDVSAQKRRENPCEGLSGSC